MEKKDILLTYQSATIRESDMENLKAGNWLNDQIINFYLEYLTHEKLQKVILICDRFIEGN